MRKHADSASFDPDADLLELFVMKQDLVKLDNEEVEVLKVEIHPNDKPVRKSDKPTRNLIFYQFFFIFLKQNV